MTPPAPVRDATRRASSAGRARALRPITIGSDHDYRIQRIVEFHAQQEPDQARIEYQPQGTWVDAGPQWLIAHRDSFELPLSHADEVRDDAGRVFTFVREFPAAPLAGLHWFVVRNQVR